MQVTTKDVKKKDKLCMKSPSSEVECASCVFKIQLPISVVNYIKITGQGQHKWNWAWHNIWNLLLINLKDKS